MWTNLNTNVEVSLPYANEALRGISGENELANRFFSQGNIDRIQTQIRYGVNIKSCGKHTIGKQSEDEIKIIMRSIYLEKSLNLSYNILEQVSMLNDVVLEFCIKRILQELEMYNKYLQDSEQLWKPMDRPVSTNVVGTKNNEFKRF